MSTLVRRLTPDDVLEYRRVRAASLVAHPEAFLVSPEEDAGTPDDEMRRRLGAADGSVVFGAFADDELVGITGLFRPPRAKMRHRAMIWGVYVEPAHRGQGLARALMIACIDHARSLPAIDAVHLSVNTRNNAARTLYVALGFEPWGIEKDAFRVDDVPQDEEHLVLRL